MRRTAQIALSDFMFEQYVIAGFLRTVHIMSCINNMVFQSSPVPLVDIRCLRGLVLFYLFETVRSTYEY